MTFSLTKHWCLSWLLNGRSFRYIQVPPWPLFIGKHSWFTGAHFHSCPPQVSMSAWRGVKQHQVLKLCLLWYSGAARCGKVFPIPKKLDKYGLYSLGDIPTALNLNSGKFSHSKTHGSPPTTEVYSSLQECNYLAKVLKWLGEKVMAKKGPWSSLHWGQF